MNRERNFNCLLLNSINYFIPVNLNRKFYENYNYYKCINDIIVSLATAHSYQLSIDCENYNTVLYFNVNIY